MSIEQSAGALALSAEDVQKLLTDTSSSGRVDMTGKIAANYNTSHLSPKELLVAEQIFRLLLRDTEIKVRESLAQYVKDSSQIPRDIVMTLARDVEQVSLPILQFSEVLSDDDLVELIGATEEVNRYLAISRRRKVSEIVTEKLIDKGNEQVASALVGNSGAALSEGGLGKIIDLHGKNDLLMQAVTKRPQLPVATVEKMVQVVSSALAASLKQKYKLMPAEHSEHLEKEVEKTREKETLNLIKLAVADSDIDKLVGQLETSGRLSPSIILSSLCQGNFEFFETSLAKLSGIPVSNARKLIEDRGELGFRAIYNKSGLPDAMFPAVKLLLKIVRELDGEGEKPGSSRYANRVVERILQYSEDTPMENLSYIIALVRRIAQ